MKKLFPPNLKGATSRTKHKNTPITLANIESMDKNIANLLGAGVNPRSLGIKEDKSMVVVNKRGSFRAKPQENLAKEDIRLLIECVNHSLNSSNWNVSVASDTRLELLIGKLKRMEKQ